MRQLEQRRHWLDSCDSSSLLRGFQPDSNCLHDFDFDEDSFDDEGVDEEFAARWNLEAVVRRCQDEALERELAKERRSTAAKAGIKKASHGRSKKSKSSEDSDSGR